MRGPVLRDFFRSQANLLSTGQIDLMVRPYHLPLPVFLPSLNDIVILRTRHDLHEAFQAKFNALAALGINYLHAQPMDSRAQSQQKGRVRVMWFYNDPHGRRTGRTVATYFLSAPGGGLKVDMIEFEQLALPAISDWFVENSMA